VDTRDINGAALSARGRIADNLTGVGGEPSSAWARPTQWNNADMTVRCAFILFAAVMVAAAGFAGVASAPDAAAPSAATTPAGDRQNPLPAAAVSSPSAADDLQACLVETGDYQTDGSAVTYLIGLTNSCDKLIRCVIDAYVVGAKGPASGHAVMILGAKSSGAAATKTYTMKVKAFGGTAQVSRDCKTL